MAGTLLAGRSALERDQVLAMFGDGYGAADVVAGCRRSRSGSVAGLGAGPARDGAAARSEGKLLPSVPADFAAHA